MLSSLPWCLLFLALPSLLYLISIANRAVFAIATSRSNIALRIAISFIHSFGVLVFPCYISLPMSPMNELRVAMAMGGVVTIAVVLGYTALPSIHPYSSDDLSYSHLPRQDCTISLHFSHSSFILVLVPSGLVFRVRSGG